LLSNFCVALPPRPHRQLLVKTLPTSAGNLLSRGFGFLLATKGSKFTSIKGQNVQICESLSVIPVPFMVLSFGGGKLLAKGGGSGTKFLTVKVVPPGFLAI